MTGEAPNAFSNRTVDFGFHRNVRIGNLVWLDGVSGGAGFNNGIADAGETGIGGVTVELWQDTDANSVFNPLLDTKIDETVTSPEGNYWFEGAVPGNNYFVAVQSVPGNDVQSSTGQSASIGANDNDDDGATVASYVSVSRVFTAPTPGSAPTAEADAIPSADGSAETEANLAGHSYLDASSNLRIDLGLISVPLFRVGNLVWIDTNKNGQADVGELPLPNVLVQIYDNAGTYIDSTVTDPSGKYFFADLAAGQYEIRVPTAQAVLSGYKTSPLAVTEPNSDTDIDNDDNGVLDIGGLYWTASLVTLGEDAASSGPLYDDEPTLEVSGLVAGTPDDDTGNTVSTDRRSNYTVDFGFYRPAMSLGNQVWIDANDNGTLDSGEPNIANGVVVNLLKANGTPALDSLGAAITTTVTSGRYVFNNLNEGTYIVEIASSNFAAGALLEGYRSSTFNGIEDAIDQNDNGIPHSSGSIRSVAFTLAEGTEPTAENPAGGTAADNNGNMTVDFGLYLPLFSLGNEIWYDMDIDGIRDVGEPIIEDGTAVRLYDENGVLVDTTTTTGGLYLFDGLITGQYYVEIDRPSGYVSPEFTAEDDALASDGTDHGTNATNAGNPVVRTGIFSLTEGSEPLGESPDNDAVTTDGNENLTFDIGLAPAFSLGNEVWLDYNNDGIKNGTEPYVPDGVRVNLYDGTGIGTPLTVTTVGGLYLFKDLIAGSYIVEIDASNFAPGGILEHWRSSTGQITTDTLAGDNHDHGAPFTNGGVRSAVIDLGLQVEPVGEAPDNDAITDDRNENLTLDFGFSTLAIGNRVFLDSVTENGVQDVGEPGVGGVNVQLWAADTSGPTGTAPIATVQTDSKGFYLFEGLLPGTYVVRIPATELTGAGPLAGYISTEGNGAIAPAPIGGVDLDDNGTQSDTGGYVQSLPLALAAATSPVGEANVPLGYSQGVLDANIDLTVDFGFVTTPPMSLGNRVWIDANDNGIMDASELGVGNVTVELYRDTNGDGLPDTALPFQTDITDTDGFYLFTGLAAGGYVVQVSPSAFLAGAPLEHMGTSAGSSLANADTDINDSGIDVAAGSPIRSSTVILSYYDEPTTETQLGVDVDLATDNNSNLTVDFGFFRLGSLGDFVWNDVNRDGIQDAGELGVPNVTVRLLDNLGNVVGTPMVTDANGKYLFDDLRPGTYAVEFVKSTLPPGFVISAATQGTDAGLNSDGDPATGRTGSWLIAPGTAERSADLGIHLAQIDLVIDKSLVGTARAGANAEWSIVVTNAGTDAVPGTVTMVDTLVASLTYISAVGDGWSCGNVGQVITCTREGGLAAGATLNPIVVITLVAANFKGTITNGASVASEGLETVSTNNTDNASGVVSTLPSTGFPIAGILTVAALLLGAGGALVVAAMRRRRPLLT